MGENASMDGPVNVSRAMAASIVVEVRLILGETIGSFYRWTEQCGSDFCYNGGECLVDPKSGTSTCSCHGNYTLADCSGGLIRSDAQQASILFGLLCLEKCSEKGLICLNDATCEREDDGDHSCQCSGQWGGVDCSASQCFSSLRFISRDA